MSPSTDKRATGRELAHRALDALIDRMIARHLKAPTTITDLSAEVALLANDNLFLCAIGGEILGAAQAQRSSR